LLLLLFLLLSVGRTKLTCLLEGFFQAGLFTSAAAVVTTGAFFFCTVTVVDDDETCGLRISGVVPPEEDPLFLNDDEKCDDDFLFEISPNARRCCFFTLKGLLGNIGVL